MKSNLFIVLILAIIGFSSCKEEDSFILSNEQVQKECQKILSSQFVDTGSGIIKFNASLDDCIKLGIHEESFFQFKDDIEKVNSYLIEQGSLCDLDTYCVDDDEIAIHTKVGSEPSGTITTYDSSPGTADFFAPNGVLAVYCYCFSSSPSCISILETSAFGGVNMRRRVGYGEIVAPLAASNCGAHLRVWTTNSNGGTFSWSCLYASDMNN